MPLMPKRVKHRKMHRGSRSGNATSGTYVAFGDFGLQVLDRGWITNNQIEACRIAINRYLKRKGKVFIRIFPQKSFTSRPPDTRMGKGKGAVEGWVAVVRPGNILFEVGGVTESQAREALRLASNKLGYSSPCPIRTPPKNFVLCPPRSFPLWCVAFVKNSSISVSSRPQASWKTTRESVPSARTLPASSPFRVKPGKRKLQDFR